MMKRDRNKYLKQTDGRTLRKVCVRLSMSTFTGIDYFEKLMPKDLRMVIDEIAEVNKPREQKKL